MYLFNEGRELRRRAGTKQVAAGGGQGESVAFDGLHFVRINAVDYVIGAQGGALNEWKQGSGATLTGGAGRLTSGSPVGAAFLPTSFNQALYLGNGVDQNARFDGGRVDVVMCSQPASGMTGSGSGVGALDGTYTYRVTFLSFDGFDSQASVATANITVSLVAQINLTGIPVAPAADECQARRLWRTISGGTTWYLVATINDNTTTTYTDTKIDAVVDTSEAVDLNAVRFPPCQVLAAHQLRLCGVLCSTSEGDKRTLYISDQQAPWYCPEVVLLDQVDDPIQGARIALPDVPVSLVTYGNVLIVFFPRSAWRLLGDNPNNWTFDRWLDVGCVSHRTARVYKSALLWLAADGVYAVEGGASGISMSRISDDIRGHLEAFTAAQLAAAHAFVWYDRYYLCVGGSAFYYDFRYRQWGELTAWSWDHSAVSDSSTTAKDAIYATATGEGEVWQLETGTDDGGAAIPAHWRGRATDMGQFGREKRVHRIICRFAVASGVATINLYRGTGDLLQTLTQDISQATRTGGVVSELVSRAVEGARDTWFDLEISHAALSSDFRLLDAGVFWSLST